jgi:hypothetical protein
MQFAEIDKKGEINILKQYDPIKKKMENVGEMKTIAQTLRLYTGLTKKDIDKDLKNKEHILKWMVENNVRELNQIGILMAKYYKGDLILPKQVNLDIAKHKS